jgi:hypothetical protein
MYMRLLSEPAAGTDTLQREHFRGEWRQLASLIPPDGGEAENGAAQLNVDITAEEVFAAVQGLKNNKAVGLDEVSAEMLKALADVNVGALHELTDIMHSVFISGDVPDFVLRSVVTLLYKRKGDNASFDNYRGITITSVLYKLLATILNRRLQAVVETAGLVHDLQNGFRKKRSCQQQAFTLLEVVGLRRRLGLPTYVAYLDLEKAYDSVNLDRLWVVLASHGIGGPFLALLRSMYKGTSIAVRTGRGELRFQHPTRGLKQGCPLSCLLFDIYINDIILCAESAAGELLPARTGHEAVRLASLWMADDGSLIAPSTVVLQRLLDAVGEEVDVTLLKFNLGKCKVQEFRWSPAHVAGEYTLQGHPLEVVDSYVYLGVRIDSQLTLRQHAAALLQTSRRALGALRGKGATGGTVPMAVAEKYAELYHDASSAFGREFLHRASDEALAELDTQQLRRDATVAGVPVSMWSRMPAFRLRYEFSRPTMRTLSSNASLSFMDRLLRLHPSNNTDTYRSPLTVARVARYSWSVARGLLATSGRAALQACTKDTLAASALETTIAMQLHAVLGVSGVVRAPRKVASDAVRGALRSAAAKESDSVAHRDRCAAFHARRFEGSLWQQHMWQPGAVAGLSVWTRMRLAASPIQLHLLACRVAGNARCRRCGTGTEEDVTHAILECTGIREAAATARLPVRAALADVPRPDGTTIPRREISKILSGAHVWSDVTGVLHAVPAATQALLAGAVIAYLEQWTRGPPAGAAAEV